MACEQWSGKLDAYLDGELETSGGRCARGAFAGLRGLCRRRAGTRADETFGASGRQALLRRAQSLRNKIAKSVAAKPRREAGWAWKILAVPALLLLILSVGVNLYVGREKTRRERVYSELADLHVSALASATPVDVVSTDRHTVKPWFQGKIPFSFNLPELQGTEFTLLGGRVTYLAQTPGAHLIYQIRKHEVSVFIFQDRGDETASLASGPVHAVSFNVENWTQDGLRYFVVGDVGAEDIQALSKLLRDAG